MSICKRYRVSGRVQGVFFRASAREEALKLGVTGWVRNLDNGDVEALACGSETQLARFEAWLHKGSEPARVDSVDSATEEYIDLNGFEIR